MKLPAIRGTIDRRILVNYRVDPEVMSQIVPRPFRPKLVSGQAVGGICLIRLKAIRPRFFPLPWGIGSENAAHRIAVEWDQDGQLREGVYIPRRDTSSRLNTLAGGRIFPGIHHHAQFVVHEAVNHYSLALDSDDGTTHMSVRAAVPERFVASPLFGSLSAASEFFQKGALGYSDAQTSGQFDGLELHCLDWKIEPLVVEDVASSFFDDPTRFPPGSVAFDSALLMRNIEHEWHGRAGLCYSEQVGG